MLKPTATGVFSPGGTAAAKPKPKWVHVSEAFESAIITMEKRQSGEIKSIKTPWDNFNDVGMDGIEWQTMMVIAARPAVGKTLVADIIAREAFKLNPDQDFAVLKLQFEMLAKNTALRELSSKLKKSVKYLNSAERVAGKLNYLKEDDLKAAKDYASSQIGREEYIVETAMSPNGIRKTVMEFAEFIRKPFLIVLDHSMLVLKDASDKDKLETLQNLGAMITELKRKYMITWIILSQLNRSIDDATRQEKAGTHGNYPNEADVFGSDALLQHADILLAINRPAKYNLEVYGPEKFMVTDKNLLAFHFLKVRSGNPRISFFMGEFDKMNIREIPPPARKTSMSTFKPS